MMCPLEKSQLSNLSISYQPMEKPSNKIYPLVNWHSHGKSPFLKTVNHLFLWAIYTMAMLVITRGYTKVIKSRYLCCSALRTSGIERTATQRTGLCGAHPARQAATVKDVPAVGTGSQGDVIGCSKVHQTNGTVWGVSPEISDFGLRWAKGTQMDPMFKRHIKISSLICVPFDLKDLEATLMGYGLHWW